MATAEERAAHKADSARLLREFDERQARQRGRREAVLSAIDRMPGGERGAPLTVFLVAAVILIALYLYRASKGGSVNLLPNRSGGTVTGGGEMTDFGHPGVFTPAPPPQTPAQDQAPGVSPAPVQAVTPIPFVPQQVIPPALLPFPEVKAIGPVGPSIAAPGGY